MTTQLETSIELLLPDQKKRALLSHHTRRCSPYVNCAPLSVDFKGKVFSVSQKTLGYFLGHAFMQFKKSIFLHPINADEKG